MRLIDDLTPLEKKSLVEEILNKKNGVTDKDWVDIITEYQLDIHPDTLRRASIGVKLYDESGIAPIVPATNEYIERQKMRDLGAKVNALYRSESRSELLRETVEAAIEKLPPINVDHNIKERTGGSRSIVVAIGDFHYGADIRVTGLFGETINLFNSNVFKRRMDMLLGEVLEIAEKENACTIDIMMVGDLIDGILRQSQLTRLEFGLVEQVIQLSEYLAKWVNAFAAIYAVNVHSVTGNHSEIRPLKSKAREFEDENLEKIIMWYLKARLKDNKSVCVDDVCDRMNLVDVLGYNFLLIHGDGKDSIDKIAMNTVNLYGEHIDFFVCGHLHKEEEYLGGATADGNSLIIRVPSMCGMDRYAQSKGYGGRAGATVMVIDSNKGRRCVYPITFD